MKIQIPLSWRRCKKLGLPKDIIKPVVNVSLEEFKQLTEKHSNIISVFNTSLEKIKNLMSKQYIFALTDPNGILLSIDYSADTEQLVKGLIVPGMSFTENSCGTNAISMAMHLHREVYFLPQHHYCHFLSNFYCYAIPIYYKDCIRGYLDVSTIDNEMKGELRVITRLLSLYMSLQLDNLIMVNQKDNKDCDKGVSKLTKQQLEILKFIADGYSIGEIAEKVYLSPRTVKFHKANIRSKLGVSNDIQAVVKALKDNLISFD